MSKYDHINFREKIEKFFWWFEANEFKNEGNCSRDTNLVLEFTDYVEKINNCDLADSLGLTSDFDDLKDAERAAAHARTIIEKTTNLWLEA